MKTSTKTLLVVSGVVGLILTYTWWMILWKWFPSSPEKTGWSDVMFHFGYWNRGFYRITYLVIPFTILSFLVIVSAFIYTKSRLLQIGYWINYLAYLVVGNYGLFGFWFLVDLLMIPALISIGKIHFQKKSFS